MDKQDAKKRKKNNNTEFMWPFVTYCSKTNLSSSGGEKESGKNKYCEHKKFFIFHLFENCNKWISIKL